MNATIGRVTESLGAAQLTYYLAPDGESLCVVWGGERIQWVTRVETSEDGRTLSFISRLGAKVPESRRVECARVLAQMNFGLRTGAFQMDPEDGELLFCISHILAGAEVTGDAIDLLVGLTFLAMDPNGVRLTLMAADRNDGEAGREPKTGAELKARLDLN